MAEGLSQQEFDDIHEAVAEAMAYVALPVQFYKANPELVDDLYREGDKGKDRWAPLAIIRASVRYQPGEEQLTRMGLQPDTDLLVFIPRQHILDWEAAQATAFEVTSDMEVDYNGERFAVSEQPRTDPLPVGQGASTDFIGMIVSAVSARP